MKTKDDKTANSGSGDDQIRKRKTYPIVEWTAEHRKEWEALDKAWITALEEGDFDRAIKEMKEMKEHHDPLDFFGVQDRYLNRAKKLVKKMRDPMHKDDDFKELLGTDHHKSLSKDKTKKSKKSKKLKKLEELWRLQICLLRHLRVHKLDSTGDDRKVAHYCRADVLSNILEEGVRLFSLSGANDPTEGKRFLHFARHAIEQKCGGKEKIGKDFIEYTANHAESMLALQCSFSNRVNDLNQFRLYGRDFKYGGEGTGICLVFKMNFFDNQYAPLIPTPDTIMQNEKESAEEKEYDLPDEDNDPYLPAYWVLYYNSKRDLFYYTPCQRETTFCTTEKDAEEQSLTSSQKAIDTQNAIQRLLKRIREVFSDLAQLNAVNEGWDLCIYLRHLIKDAAFRDEQEIRVLKLCPFGDAQVKPINGVLSCPYHRIFVPECDCPLTAIIAGPKVKGFRVLRDLTRHILTTKGALKDVEVVQSDAPLA